MLTAIIGYGFVGSALGKSLKHIPLICDPHRPQGIDFDSLANAEPDVIFLALPTPTVNGHCDDTLIMDYIHRLRGYDGQLIVKSTIPVETVDKIDRILPGFIYWPELLREKTADADMLSPTITVVGTRNDVNFYWFCRYLNTETNISIKDDTIFQVTPTEASIFKYTVNSFLSTKVVFMHQMYLWLKERGEETSWKTLSSLFALEGRIGGSHLKVPGDHGYGFSGTCFPKDTEALAHQARLDGFNLELLEAVIASNKNLRNK